MRVPRYPEYRDSGIEWVGRIPVEWGVAPLKYGYSVIGGSTPRSDDIAYWDGDISWFTPADLSKTSKMELTVSLRRITSAGLNSCGTTLVPPGSVILSTRAPIGSLGITSEFACTNQGCKALVPNRHGHSNYLAYLLSVVGDELNIRGRGTTFLELSGDELGAFKTPFPSFADQLAIASFLDHETTRIDKLIAQQQRLIDLLKEKRQAVISHAVTKGLDPNVPMKDSEVEWLGEVPVNWAVKPSKYLFDFVTSGSRGWAEYYADDGELFFRIANLTRDSIEPKLESVQYVKPPANAEGERSRIRVGDILISITADLGSVCVANDLIESGYVSQHVALARPLKESICSRWLGYCVLATPSKEQLVGAGYGGTKVQLSLDDIKTFFVAVPSHDEQEVIANFLDDEIKQFDALIYEASEGVALLVERRSVLISAAVTGKIDVRNWQPDESSTNDEYPLADEKSATYA